MGMKNIRKVDELKLVEIAKATIGEGVGYLFCDEVGYERLLYHGFVEVNKEIADGEEYATRASEKGINRVKDKLNKSEEGEKMTEEKEVEHIEPIKDNFKVVTGVPIPDKEISVRCKYPFGDLVAPVENGDGKTVYSSFHIAKTEERPKPKQSMYSTVYNANKRFEDREFKMFTVNSNDSEGAGVRVFRIK